MKRAFSLLLAALFVLLAGCSEYHPVKPVGTVPEEFVPLIESGLLRKYGAKATANGFLDVIPTDSDGDDSTDYTEFVKYDKYGAELARGQLPLDDVHGHWLAAVTSDDGFLVLNGYSFYPDYDTREEDPKPEEVSSDLVKFDRLCNIEWTLTMPGCNWYNLRHCFETERGYVFFGVKAAGKTYGADTSSSPDIYIVQVSFSGEVTKTVMLSGGLQNRLYCVTAQTDGFLLYLSFKSDDGDPSETYLIFRLDDDLNCIFKEPVPYDPLDRNDHSYYFDSFYYYNLVGYLDGTAVYSDDPRFADPDDQRIAVYDGGEVLSVMDYGTFYLVVSYNLTGEPDDSPPASSRSWWTSETVYTAFDKDGVILWRTAVDNAE